MENNSADNSAPTTEVTESTEQAAQTPPAPTKKKYTYKAEGADVTEELSDEEVQSRLSLSKVAQKRLQEASLTRKQAEQFIQALQNDPMSVLNNDKIMGQKKFREIAEKFLSEQLKQEMLSPQERQQQEKDERLKRYEEQEKEAKTQKEAEQAQKLEEHYAQEYQKTIISALESSSLPKNPFTVKRMAELMQKNLQHGLELEPQQLAQIVKEDLQNELKSTIGSASPEQLIQMFGQEIANKIRKHDLAQLQPKQSNFNPQATQTPQPNQKRVVMNPREYTEHLKAQFPKK